MEPYSLHHLANSLQFCINSSWIVSWKLHMKPINKEYIVKQESPRMDSNQTLVINLTIHNN